MMKKTLKLLFTIACLFSGILAFSKVFAEELANIDGTVTSVVDGDTIYIQASGFNNGTDRWKIRLIGIDTPETHLIVDGKVYSQGYWGKAAHEYVARALPLSTHVKVQNHGTDKYNRMLGRIYYKNLKDKVMDMNLRIVASGWAIPYLICGPKCTPEYFENFGAGSYIKACNFAREHNLGIFSKEKPLKEMPFEFRLRVQKRKADKWVGNFETKKLYSPEEYKKVDVCERVFFASRAEANGAGYY